MSETPTPLTIILANIWCMDVLADRLIAQPTNDAKLNPPPPILWCTHHERP